MERYQGFDPATKSGYLWPPRAERDHAIRASRLTARERDGAWAQVKKNGTNNTLYVRPDRIVLAMNRHHAEHKLWHPIMETHRTFADLPGDGWYVFCAELLHSKVAGLRNINYIHDILVADSTYLVGTTFQERQEVLGRLFPNAIKPLHGIGYRVIDPNTWLAENFRPNPHVPGFANLFRSLTAPEDEGLVLKRPDAKLAFCHKETANGSWQWKCVRSIPKLAGAAA